MDKLEEVQRAHLEYLETEGLNSPIVEGVPVLLPFTYDLVQVFNNLYLKEILEESEENSEQSND